MEIVLEFALPLCIRHTTKILVHGMLLLKIVVIFRQSVKGQQEVIKLKKTKFHILVYCPWDGLNWVYYAVTNQCYRVCSYYQYKKSTVLDNDSISYLPKCGQSMSI